MIRKGSTRYTIDRGELVTLTFEGVHCPANAENGRTLKYTHSKSNHIHYCDEDILEALTFKKPIDAYRYAIQNKQDYIKDIEKEIEQLEKEMEALCDPSDR